MKRSKKLCLHAAGAAWVPPCRTATFLLRGFDGFEAQVSSTVILPFMRCAPYVRATSIERESK